jgi:hypothetical protein
MQRKQAGAGGHRRERQFSNIKSICSAFMPMNVVSKRSHAYTPLITTTRVASFARQLWPIF